MKLNFTAPDLDPAEALSLILNEGKLPKAGEPIEPLRGIIFSAFDILCRELGLADDPRTVDMSFVSELKGSDGQTNNEATGPFKVSVSMNQSPWSVLSTIAHEMVHVRDIATDTLLYKNGDLYYRNKKMDGDVILKIKEADLDSAAIPYEREAYDRMWPLALKVLEGLSPEHRDYLNGVYVKHLKPPTLGEYYNQQLVQRKELMAKSNLAFHEAKRRHPGSQFAKYENIYDVLT